MEEAVGFSVAKVEIINEYEELKDSTDDAFTKKYTYFVQNRCITSKNVRVSIQKDSDPVRKGVGPYALLCFFFYICMSAQEGFIFTAMKLCIHFRYLVCYMAPKSSI